MQLSKAAVAEILRWAERYPRVEVCGLVWRSEGRYTVRPLSNVHSEPAKYYRTDPRDVRQAFAAMDREGGEPVAWYHSHPGGKPDPSETDMQGAMDTEMHYLIAYPEMHSVFSGGGSEPIRTDRVWQLSVWECLEPGILVGAEMEVVP